jgi:hypothetical protein
MTSSDRHRGRRDGLGALDFLLVRNAHDLAGGRRTASSFFLSVGASAR